MKHYYIRKACVNESVTKDVGENLLKFRGYRVLHETDAICIITKG